MAEEFLKSLEMKLLDNEESLSFDQSLRIARLKERYWPSLINLSGKVKDKYSKKGVYICSIMSAKTGGCSENCSFCAQSAHNKTPIPAHGMIEPQALLKSAKEAEGSGASEFCIVTSGRSPDKKTFRKVLDAVRLIRVHTNLSIGCSLGILTEEQARGLSEAGVNRYNHNLETSRSFFPYICSTHSYEDRLRTAYLVKENGMELCCGGIFGMGESPEQRVELAFELNELNPHLIPINFLNPRPGTVLSGRSLLKPFEAVKIISLFRLILPRSILICAGGRQVVLRNLQSLALLAGANAIITGNYLTTPGCSPNEDLQMIRDLGLPILDHD
ncbi:MAG TPA: biotin synthase BioB [Thermodesulfobacteriota bacterium]|nr:biotin synthase BioB [Thermodesulfobacteriota bacterium]